eukprot:TRINITY_DN3587_c0_g1_i1.p1 TRINITY_DN3587_c0_g1~~TRINITY_DN3587_c0_g1_i1.p1  ORF type:complete len:170 (+),score=37.56 TRINITY_DN3587_c0_g1_i1:10-519(+)
MGRVVLVSGECHSGKTTTLGEWITKNKQQHTLGGVLAPDKDVGGMKTRHMIHLRNGTEKKLQIRKEDAPDDQRVDICDYSFSKAVFDWGNECILQDFENEVDFLIIDEIGPLEIRRGGGLELATKQVMEKRKEKKTIIMVVIRAKMVDDLKEHYGLQEEEVQMFSDFIQ